MNKSKKYKNILHIFTQEIHQHYLTLKKSMKLEWLIHIYAALSMHISVSSFTKVYGITPSVIEMICDSF